MIGATTESGIGWTERWWYALGSDAHLQVAGGPLALADRAMEELERLEQVWSRFRADSELQRLNSTRASAVSVSSPMAEALHRAVLAWQLTDGWFDPTVIDSLEAAGYDSVFPSGAVPGAPRPRGDLRGCRPSGGLDSVTVDLERGIVRRPPGMRFDLGGIGKGLAADHLAVWLVEHGAVSVCIGLGGDVRVAGIAPTGGWHIPVVDPTADTGAPDGTATGSASRSRVWFDAALTDGAIVTSTTRFRRWTTLDGSPAHHLIDPSSGRPSTSGVATVVVAAAEAWWAEVLAKAALLAGPVAGQDLLDRHGVRGWIVDEPAVDLADHHTHRVVTTR